MSELLRVRGGLPRFARRVLAGEPATVVAFGTSMTVIGRYLERVVPALSAATGNHSVELIARGLRGFTSMMAAFRVTSDVLPYAPHVVLLEFSHNERGESAVAAIPDAIHGIVAQVRAAYPLCEFAVVELAAPGDAAHGPSAAMTAHEDVAGYFGFPSIDLATVAERLVARGAATWSEGPAALTTDGIHHAASAADALGEPFARSFVELVRASAALAPATEPVRASPFARVDRRAAAAFAGGAQWSLERPREHESRNAEAYDDTIAVPRAAGATLRVPFDGTRLIAWLRGEGRLRIVMPEYDVTGEARIESGREWDCVALTPVVPAGRHTVDLVCEDASLGIGDFMVTGGAFSTVTHGMLRVRAGIPRFARRLRAGEDVAIVAFGSSLTQEGRYLEQLVAQLRAAVPNASVRLVVRGRRGYTTGMGAFGVESDVLPAAPDLVLIEFSVNDVTPDALAMLPGALHGIVARIRAAHPQCEFALVECAVAGAAAAEPTAAMRGYEEAAEHFGFPSFDLATFAEELVAGGGAGWTGEGPALTSDGVHHTAAAGELLGRPFARAFLDLIDRSAGLEAAPVAARPSEYALTARRPASAFLRTGGWALGRPEGDAGLNVEAYGEAVSIPVEPGATMRVDFVGTRVFAWVLGAGAFEVRLRGTDALWQSPDVVWPLEVASGHEFRFTALCGDLPPGQYAIDVSFRHGQLAVGDVMVRGAFR